MAESFPLIHSPAVIGGYLLEPSKQLISEDGSGSTKNTNDRRGTRRLISTSGISTRWTWKKIQFDKRSDYALYPNHYAKITLHYQGPCKITVGGVKRRWGNVCTQAKWPTQLKLTLLSIPWSVKECHYPSPSNTGWDANLLLGYPPVFYQATLKICQYPFILLYRERHSESKVFWTWTAWLINWFICGNKFWAWAWQKFTGEYYALQRKYIRKRMKTKRKVQNR